MGKKLMEGKQPVSRIAQLRERVGLTQLELSRLVGVTENTIANWEKGRSGLEWIERLSRLCKALDCTLEELIEYVSATQIEELVGETAQLIRQETLPTKPQAESRLSRVRGLLKHKRSETDEQPVTDTEITA